MKSFSILALLLGLSFCTRLNVPAKVSEEDGIGITMNRLIEEKSRNVLGEAFTGSGVQSVNISKDDTDVSYHIDSKTPTADGDDTVSRSYIGHARLKRNGRGWNLDKIEAVTEELQFEKGLVITNGK